MDHMRKSKESRSDVAVQGTNDSSIVSKLSAAKHGYYQDDFLHLMVRKSARRSPLINRGYYIRAKAIDYTLRKFLEWDDQEHHQTNKKKQLLSLGAGFDTLYFRNHAAYARTTVVYEVDFPDVVATKAQTIRSNHVLKSAIGNEISNAIDLGGGIATPYYKLIGVDLKKLAEFEKCLLCNGLDPKLPTFVLSECVLTYINPRSSSNIIQWAAKFFTDVQFVNYEQIQPNDAFGSVMCNHFKQIGSPLMCIDTYSTKSAQAHRYLSLSWQDVIVFDMNEFYYKILSKEEQQRIEHLEPFDEFTEWHLKCFHYVLICAFTGSLKHQPWLIELKQQLAHTVDEAKNYNYRLTNSLSCELSDISTMTNLQRFGHRACLMQRDTLLSCDDSDVFMIVGGFGVLANSCHGRQEDISVFRITSGKSEKIMLIDSVELKSPRLYHTVTPLCDGKVLIFGGRASPLKPYNTSVMVSFNFEPLDVEFSSTAVNSVENCRTTLQFSNNGKLRWKTLASQGDIPSPRWKHSATVLDGSKVLIHGGLSTHMRILDDIYLFDVSTNQWSKVKTIGSVPARHSHTACWWNDFVIIYGGLGSELRPVTDVFGLNVKNQSSMNWSSFVFCPQPPPRYGHTAHIVDDRLLILGGIDPFSTSTNELIEIDLHHCTWKKFSLEPSNKPQRPIMLHNHDSVIVGHGENKKILTIGGGGNCFSFGTHFNSCVIKVTPQSLL